MNPKRTITNEDLLILENRINKEQQEARHQQNNNIQEIHFDIDELKNEFNKHIGENNLLKQSMANIEKDINEMKDTLKEFIKKADDTYATKKELKLTNEDVEKIKSNNKDYLKALIGAMVTIILALIGVIWSNLQNIVK